MNLQQVWHGKPNILVYISCTSHEVFSCENWYLESSFIRQIIEERNFDVSCDSHKRNKSITMNYVVSTVEQNVEDCVSDIMEDMLNNETKLWYINLKVYYWESCHMCIDLYVEERRSYEVC